MVEALRLFLLRWVLPGQLAGILPGDWIRLLRENRYDVDPRFALRALSLTMASTANAAVHSAEKARLGSQLEDVDIPPPIFILGHYRSGTSLLHQLMALDQRFAYPTTFQVLFPHTFITSEPYIKKPFGAFLPRTRIYDRMPFGFDVPQEDEFALCVLTGRSHFMRYVFPNRWSYYDRYLTFRNVPRREITAWQNALVYFLKKLTLVHDKPLILKSPAHTGRIRWLLELFPDARFVHIHRHPFTVFQSTRHMISTAMPAATLQRLPAIDLDAAVIRSYREMYDAFFRDRALIPDGHFHEMAFANLEESPVEQTHRLYRFLGLEGFAEFRPQLERHVASLAHYRKNVYPPLDGAVRRRLKEVHGRCFEEWGYDDRPAA